MTEHDGGPAVFPGTRMVPSDSGPNVWKYINSDGLSLRDYFAAQALIGIYMSVKNLDTSEGGSERVMEAVARWSYQQADALLAEREKERQ